MFIDFLKKRSIAFFLLIPVTLFSLITIIIYGIGFGGSDFYDFKVILFLILSIISIVLACFKVTERYAGIVVFTFILLAFVTFVDTSYMLLSTKFFNGIDKDMNILEQAGYEWSFTLIFIVLNLILTFIASFFEGRKAKKNQIAEKENI